MQQLPSDSEVTSATNHVVVRDAVTQADPHLCPHCSAAESAVKAGTRPSFVYAVGTIEPRFPRLSVEKEFAQVTGRADTAGLSDRQTLQKIISQRENRYLVRQMCWVLTIGGLETYLLVPRDPADFELLVAAVRPVRSPMDLDVIVGARGPIAPPDMCNGLTVPIVAFDQIYSFDRQSLIKAIPRPDGIKAKEFEAAAEDVFDRITQLTDNAGATDEHRALNYLAMRYHEVYSTAAAAFERNASLSAVEVLPSRLSSTRRVANVIFSYTSRKTDVTERFFVRVDVTEEFPFLVSKLQPYVEL